MAVTPDNSTYIGDGVYAEPDGYGGVILRTTRREVGLDDNMRVANVDKLHWIALDARTWAALVGWMASKEAEHRQVAAELEGNLAATCEDYQ